jgi:hypothetical protein
VEDVLAEEEAEEAVTADVKCLTTFSKKLTLHLM